ncbi:MAG TPA: M24 family metallopeptidase [Gaiellaceae bacterium]|nr:M24 family metallopeptidase [Gaiellaceae bacterium]
MNVLPVREQSRVVGDVLRERLDTLLPALMRETGFDMWVIACNEDNYDPVFRTITPWDVWAPILQLIVFFDRGDDVERLNISLTDLGDLMAPAWRLTDEDDQWATFRRIVHERDPKRIGINVSDTIWAADGLTASLRDRVVATLGKAYEERLASAEPLCIRWLETRLPRELALYEQACAIAHEVIATCFSRRTITPGVTTTDDLRWSYWQAVTNLGLPVSFPAFYRLHRSPRAREDHGDRGVIHPGDLLHCDVGLEYLRLITDHQEMAYVLRPGETDAPEGLREGIAEANRLQDVFVSCWREGATGNDILADALTRARQADIPKPKIYSHSLSHYLHEPGPLMGLPWEQTNTGARGDIAMRYDTTYTVELSITRRVHEWDDAEVTFALEQDATFTRDGVTFVDGRQTQLHLV